MAQLSEEVLVKIEAIPGFDGWRFGGREPGFPIFSIKGTGDVDEFDSDPIVKMVSEKLTEIFGAEFDDFVCFSVTPPLRVQKAYHPDGALLEMSESERKDLIPQDAERLAELLARPRDGGHHDEQLDDQDDTGASADPDQAGREGL